MPCCNCFVSTKIRVESAKSKCREAADTALIDQYIIKEVGFRRFDQIIEDALGKGIAGMNNYHAWMTTLLTCMSLPGLGVPVLCTLVGVCIFPYICCIRPFLGGEIQCCITAVNGEDTVVTEADLAQRATAKSI
jgi:hypothetical protein